MILDVVSPKSRADLIRVRKEDTSESGQMLEHSSWDTKAAAESDDSNVVLTFKICLRCISSTHTLDHGIRFVHIHALELEVPCVNGGTIFFTL
jgi:hypothetical protein